jgi:tetratricopeptide (TPR) repeat protein
MSTRYAVRAVTTALFVLTGAVSCRPDDQRTDTLDAQQGMQSREEMPPAAVAQLDSGTAAYRVDDFEGALRHYTRVTELAPDIGAGWFGVYMAEEALGRPERAAEAMERARSLVPGATLLHEGDAPR